jgi:hypothetical protein
MQNILLEFTLGLVWAQIIAVVQRHFFWRDRAFAMTAISGLAGAVVGWFSGAMFAVQWDELMPRGHRLLLIGVIISLFVAAIQRAFSKDDRW